MTGKESDKKLYQESLKLPKIRGYKKPQEKTHKDKTKWTL